MKVVSKVSSGSLLKDHEYEVSQLYNDGTSNSWIEGRLYIENLGRFNVENFKMPGGGEIPKIKIEKTSLRTKELKDTKIGDMLLCKSESYVLFKKDSLYKVADLKIVERKWFNSTYREIKVKFEGINRWIKLSNWNFRQLSDQEKREINLENLLNDKEPDIVRGKKRKIDLEENKEDFLMREISKSILDKKRHHLSVVEWVIEKTGKKSKLKKEDFDEILNMKLSDILKNIK